MDDWPDLKNNVAFSNSSNFVFLNALSFEVHPLLANFLILAAPVSLFRALTGLSELLESVSNFLST